MSKLLSKSRCRLVSDICQKAVAKGFRCIFSNQGYWYLDHLDVPWDEVYNTEPLNGIEDPSLQKLVIGGEVCMWGETADTSVVLQTIWPRAAAAAGNCSQFGFGLVLFNCSSLLYFLLNRW